MFNRRAVNFTLLVLIFCVSLAGCGDPDKDDVAATPTPSSPSSNQAGGTPPGAATPASSNAGAPKTASTDTQLVPMPGNYEGNLDAANCEGIIGWAWDRNQPNTPLRLDVYDGETKIETVTASSVRDDLVKVGKGNGGHGFVLLTPARLRDGKPHSIWLALSGTNFYINKPNPIRLTCPAR
ncbi:MAG TPA: hypothetical protein VF659_15185 [Pyrinomonadaceae bacterium]|jgi:hypothetical protein